MGLVGNFAYPILDVMEVELKDGSEQIILLRNPWGTKEWIGDWSDSSNIWTDDLRKKLNWHKSKSAEEKEFWISFGDFCHYFSRVQICKAVEGYNYSWQRLTPLARPSCFRMKVARKSNVFITVSQPNNGYSKYRSYKYAIIRLIIAKIDYLEEAKKYEYRYMKGSMKVDMELCEEGTYDEGEYLLYVEIDKKKPIEETISFQYTPMAISTYAEKDVELLGDEWAQHPMLLEKGIYILRFNLRGQIQL